MKVFLLAIVGALAVAALSGWLLSMAQTQSSAKFSTESVRLGEPGHNLLVNSDQSQTGRTEKRAAGD